MDAKLLGEILPCLRLHGVKRFKCADFELELSPDPIAKAKAEAEVEAQMKKQAEEQEKKLPPDLRADETMKEDTILNWSAPDGPGDPVTPSESMPMTGDAPIDPPSPAESPA
jgi:hypothetical protein